jgi:3-oxoacyl-[acyl-carrier-protein] synthase III
VHADGLHTAVVAVETLFRHTRADVPRPHLVFGDAAAAAILVPGEGRVHRAWMRNDMAIDGGARLFHGDVDDPSPPFTFLMTSREMTQLAVGWVVTAAREAVAAAGVTLDEVDWVLPHQPNGPMRDRILAALGKGPEASVDVVGDLGSVGAASIAAGLHRLRRTGRVRPGDRVLLAGVGGGGTYGALVIEPAA